MKRALEFCVFFIALPALVSWLELHGWMYVLLWVLTLLALYGKRRWYGYSLRADWNSSALTHEFWRITLLRFLPFALILAWFTWYTMPERLLSLPRQRPQLFLMVLFLYPLLSVIPQEFIYRSYFFRRFSGLFKTELALIQASALCFGWLHIVLQNWVAMVFSFLGGLLFAETYNRTRSLAAVSAEHALYGCYLFTLGLGVFFHHGFIAAK